MSEATKAQAINTYQGKSFKPKDEDAESTIEQALMENEDFVKWLNRIADYASAQSNSDYHWERRRKTIKLRNYILGNYSGLVDRERGWVNDKEDGDGLFFDPQTATFIDTLVASFVKARPKKTITPRQSEQIDKREAAKVAEALLQHDEETIFTPKRTQREWKWNLLPAGETYRITYYNPQKQGCGVYESDYEDKEVSSDKSYWYCPLCDAHDELSISDGDKSGDSTPEQVTCNKCQNSRVDIYEKTNHSLKVKKGKKYKNVGDVEYDIPDALEMTVIGETDAISEALIVNRDRLIPRCVLEDALDEENLPSTDIPTWLSYKDWQAGTKDYEIDESERIFEKLHFQELWVAPAVCSNYKFPVDTVLGGQTFKAGTKAKDLFTDGFYFSRIKTKITDLYPQRIGDCLTHCVNSLGERFHGQGEWDLSELQDQLTEAKSMKMNSLLLDSTTPLLIRGSHIDTEEFENKFGVIVDVPDDYGLDQPLDNLMTRVQPAQPPQEAYQVGEEIKLQMQSRVAAVATNAGDGGQAEAVNKTASAYLAHQEQTLGRRAPMLMLYSQMQVEQAYQILEKRQEFWCDAMYEEVAKDLGSHSVKYFKDCNIRQDIIITVVPDSWMPQTETQKRLDFQEFMSITGDIIMAKQDPNLLDELLRKATTVYGGIDFADFEADNLEAQIRLDNLKEVASYIEQQGNVYDVSGTVNPEVLLVAYEQTSQLSKVIHNPMDEQDIFAILPLDVMLDTHIEFQEFYTDWLKSAQGRDASQFLRTAVRELANYHIQAASRQQMRMNELQAISEEPNLQAELAAGQATGEQEVAQQEQLAEIQNQGQPDPAEQAEEEMGQEFLGRMLDENDKQADHQRALELENLRQASKQQQQNA